METFLRLTAQIDACTALVFLIAKFFFAIFIKFLQIAFWAAMWYNFIHEILFSFLCFRGGMGFRDKTIILHGVQGLNFHLTLQYQTEFKEKKHDT